MRTYTVSLSQSITGPVLRSIRQRGERARFPRTTDELSWPVQRYLFAEDRGNRVVLKDVTWQEIQDAPTGRRGDWDDAWNERVTKRGGLVYVTFTLLPYANIHGRYR